MITLSQIKQADRIADLSDYYVFSISADASREDIQRITAVSALRVSDREVLNEACLPVCSDDNGEDPAADAYPLETVAEGISKLVLDSTVIAEPDTVVLLRSMLDRFGFDGTIEFLPACHLASAVFPSISDDNISMTAEKLRIPADSFPDTLRNAYLEANIFERCREAISSGVHAVPADNVPVQPPVKEGKLNADGSKRKKVSDDTLNHLEKTAWTASPWVLGVLAITLLILAAILLPRSGETEVDRNVAPVSYLVLSWNETGKYGTQPKARAGEEKEIQFRIPYGVYNVLNNNSIPVELHIIDENASESGQDAKSSDNPAAAELSAGDSADDEEESSNSKVILRPNSSRQITIDTDQYLTLSEDAKDLIFFYVSAVPEEPESDTTGQVHAGQTVIYAYVKGSEVRFRRAPSLEGQIIDTLNNGQQVQVLAIAGEWTHVQVQDQKGYIFSQYLTTEDPNQKAAAAAAAAAATEFPAADAAPSSDADEPVADDSDTSPSSPVSPADEVPEEESVPESSPGNQ